MDNRFNPDFTFRDNHYINISTNYAGTNWFKCVYTIKGK